VSLMSKLPLLFPEEKGAGGMSLESFRRPGVLINRARRDQRPRRSAPPPEGVLLMPIAGGSQIINRHHRTVVKQLILNPQSLRQLPFDKGEPYRENLSLLERIEY